MHLLVAHLNPLTAILPQAIKTQFLLSVVAGPRPPKPTKTMLLRRPLDFIYAVVCTNKTSFNVAPNTCDPCVCVHSCDIMGKIAVEAANVGLGFSSQCRMACEKDGQLRRRGSSEEERKQSRFSSCSPEARRLNANSYASAEVNTSQKASDLFSICHFLRVLDAEHVLFGWDSWRLPLK